MKLIVKTYSSKPRFKVGDRVKVRTLKDLESEYGKQIRDRIVGQGSTMNSDMQEFCGQVVTIDAINVDHYRIKEFEYFWNDWMFEKKKVK
jgi:hypothetical protein